MALGTTHVGMARHERGQGLVEYALVLTFVSIALVGALSLMGGQSNGLYSHILTTIGSVTAML
jgi:Flp pilus assembly pilin Flp